MKKPATTCSPLVHSPCGSLAEREFHTSSILDLPRFSELTTSLVARDESMAFSAHVAHGCRLNKNLSVHGKNTLPKDSQMLGTAPSLVANTSSGLVLGSSDSIPGCFSWFGIPYAHPPTGDQRWRPPRPPATWAGIRDGSSDTHPSCLQTPTTGYFVDDWPWIDRLLVPLTERVLPRWRPG